METTPVKSTFVQRSESEIRALLKEQEEGNVTVKEFCEIYGIHAATLYNWRKKYNLKTEKEPFDGVTTMILKVQGIEIFPVTVSVWKETCLRVCIKERY